jgi:hypothetical protein
VVQEGLLKEANNKVLAYAEDSTRDSTMAFIYHAAFGKLEGIPAVGISRDLLHLDSSSGRQASSSGSSLEGGGRKGMTGISKRAQRITAQCSMAPHSTT